MTGLTPEQMLQMTQIGQQGDIAKMNQLLGTLTQSQRAPLNAALARRARAEAFNIEHPEIGFTYQAMLENVKKAETPAELDKMAAETKRIGQQGGLDAARTKSILSMIDVEKRLKSVTADALKVNTASGVLKTLKEIELIEEKITDTQDMRPAEKDYLVQRAKFLKQQVSESEELTPARRKLLYSQAGYYDAMAAGQKAKAKGLGSLTNAEWMTRRKYLDKLATNLASADVDDNVKRVLAPSWNRMSDENYMWALGPEEQGMFGAERELVQLQLPFLKNQGRRVTAAEVYEAANDPNFGFGGDMIAVIARLTGQNLPEYSTPKELGERQESIAWEVLP